MFAGACSLLVVVACCCAMVIVWSLLVVGWLMLSDVGCLARLVLVVWCCVGLFGVVRGVVWCCLALCLVFGGVWVARGCVGLDVVGGVCV